MAKRKASREAAFDSQAMQWQQGIPRLRPGATDGTAGPARDPYFSSNLRQEQATLVVPWVYTEEIWTVDDEIVNHIQNSRIVCTLPAGYWMQVKFQRSRVFFVFCFRNWVFFFLKTMLCLHFSSFEEQRLLSSCGVLASHCSGFTLWSAGSRAPGFRSCSDELSICVSRT